MDFTRVLNIASDNDKRKLEELRIKKQRSMRLKNEGSLVKTDAIKSFLHKKEMEKRKIEVEGQRRRDELLNLRAAAKNNRKATAMAKRTKDNNFLSNAQQQDDRTTTREKDENRASVPVIRTNSGSDKLRHRTTPKLDHVDKQQKYQHVPTLGKSEKNRIPMKTPVKSDNVKTVISAKNYRNSRLCPKSDKKGLDFNSLMKLAKTKQYEPIVIESKPKPKPETEARLMTEAERNRFNEERTRKLGVDTKKSSIGLKNSKPIPKITQNKMETTTKKPDLNKTKPDLVKNKMEVRQKINPQQKRNSQIQPSARTGSVTNGMKRPIPPAQKFAELPLPSAKKPRIEPIKPEVLPKPRPLEKRPLEKRPLEKRPLEKRPLEKRPLEKRPLEKQRLPPIGHVMSPRRTMGPPKSRFPVGPIRRRLESDEDEEEMDDFIDDGPVGLDNEDYSKHIREIFGYDRRRYAMMDDDADCMESSFSRQMQEEAYSTRVGLLEDLEDIRKEQEELEKKYTCKKKKK